MSTLSEESRSLIDPVAKRLAVSHKSVSIRSILEEIYGSQLPDIVERELSELGDQIRLRKTELMKELYTHIWSNITNTKEKKVRELKRTHDRVVETTTIYKPIQLPQTILLQLYQAALNTESGAIEINDVLENSIIRPPEISRKETPLEDL